MKNEITKFKLPSWLNLALIIAEVVLMVFLVTVSIIAMVTADGQAGGNAFMDWIKWLQFNPIWMFMIVVFPLIVFFLFNVYLLIKALNNDKEKKFDAAGMTKEQLIEEARRQAREELLKEMESADKK